jgi:ribosomal 30S subunit maturation factor RimM
MTQDIWMDLAGFEVSALDGTIGKVTEVLENHIEGSRCLVVRPGRLHRRHVVPASLVREVNGRQHLIRVAMTRHEIFHAPTYRPHDTWQAGAAGDRFDVR